MTALSIVVAGDFGRNIFVEDRTDKIESRQSTTSGAALTARILGKILGGVAAEGDQPSFNITPWLPTNATLKELPILLGWRRTSNSNKEPVDAALRVCQVPPYDVPLDVAAPVTIADGLPATTDFLVIHDAGGGWRTRFNRASPQWSSFERLLESLSEYQPQAPKPRIFVHVSGTLPSVKSGSRQSGFTDPVWQLLYKHRRRVCVVCSATPIREDGGAVSRRLSWELTIEDLATDMLLFDPLRALSRFPDLVVRFGHAAAVHIRTYGHRKAGRLIFSPRAKDGIYRDPAEAGRVIGTNSMLIASLVRRLGRLPPDDLSKDGGSEDWMNRYQAVISEALHAGLLAGMQFFDRGYPAPSSSEDIIDEICEDSQVRDAIIVDSVLNDPPPGKSFVSVPIPCHILRRPPGSITGQPGTWEILRDQINAEASGGLSGGTPRANIGEAIALFGVDSVLNRPFSLVSKVDRAIVEVLQRPPPRVSAEEPEDHVTLPPQRRPLLPDADTPPPPPRQVGVAPRPVFTPIAQFSNLTTVERTDIESFRSARNLIKKYVEDYSDLRSRHMEKVLKPLSIAVFGPPGSGKSFAVRQMLESINTSVQASPKLTVIETNVSQFRSVEDLEHLFSRVQSYRIKNELLPVVFFDEFDTDYTGSRLGWIKHFLAPMQDGVFYTAREPLAVTPAVFIFAGGIYPSFQQFDPSEPSGIDREPSASPELQSRIGEFKEKKGPDFVSRLRGHVNIFSIDAPDGYTKPIIRRALALRGLLEARSDNLVSNQVSGAASAKIDGDIVYALLTVDRFRHGTRSLEAILQMCTVIDGQIQKASLPSRQQLNMHVDADEFFIRMYRSRFRGRAEVSAMPNASSREKAEHGGPASGEKATPLKQLKETSKEELRRATVVKNVSENASDAVGKGSNRNL